MKHFVNIIQKKLNGINSILLILICTFIVSSCSTISKYRKYNYFNGVNYYNDTLNISATFFADIEYAIPSKKNFNKKVLKKIGFNNLLVFGKAILITEEYEVSLFYKIEKNESSPDFSNGVLMLNDTINRYVLYKKKKKEKTFFLYLKSLTKSNQTILEDGKSIINSVRFDVSLKNELNYSKIFNAYKNENNFLYVNNKFDTAPIKKSRKNDWMKFQYLATILSRDPTYPKYNNLIEKFESNKKKYLDKKTDSLSMNNKSITNNSVIKEISRLSETKQIVMLNEMHWKPEHRILASKLLKPLKEKGYEYLAIEAIDKQYDSILNIRKFPTQNTGYYTREPYFGLFIRKALDLGFKVIGYDDFNTDDREKSQAKNIKSILDVNPKAKVFVYAGIDHILEKSSEDSSKRMAEIFKMETGIDPLTIDQVELVSNTKNKLTLLNSKVFEKEKKINSNVDYFIINNLKSSLNEIDTNLKTIPFSIQNESLASYEKKEVLVSLYFTSEYLKYKSNSIPVLNRIKSVVNNEIKIHFPKGNYYLSVKDIDNNKLILKEIEVK